MNSLPGDMLVIDAGIGFRLVAPHPEQENLRNRLESAFANGIRLHAPSLWRYELTSIFSKAIHFKQMTEAEARLALQLSFDLPVELVQPNSSLSLLAFDWTRRLGRAAAYDSFYLALAEQFGCELWTIDRRLVNAVNRPWVRLVGSAIA